MIEKKDLFQYGYQAILIFGIAILAPLATSQVADLIFPESTSKDIIQAEAGTEEYKAQNTLYMEMRRTAQKNQFYIKAIGGLGFLIVGTMCPITTVGGGFLIGGLSSLGSTYISHWDQTTKLVRLLSLLAALVILAFASKRSWKD